MVSCQAQDDTAQAHPYNISMTASPSATLWPVIAIDGPAASGKTTLAKRLAARFGFDRLNTGLLYRAVGHKLFAEGHDEGNVARAVAIASTLTAADLDDPILPSATSGQRASRIAGLQPVRDALLAYQRAFCARPPNAKRNKGGAVLDGRDIGSFIWPQAPAKFFVTASADIRAARRMAEIQQNPLQGAVEPVTHAAVLADLAARDARDAANSPYSLKIASGAYLLDNTFLDVEASLIAAAQFASSRF